ncbi:YncE family protein [Nocardioides sambongensis]|uniref:hypothetical protein n=1 Tax=Nocardioides sambongensis TaxID=2589074 RepID=UPI001125FEA4|nr:hypothetical protein [Nocardioides sambongensis]
MTERLTQLLHDEASALETPAPPTGAILERARRTRARRRTGVAAAGAGAVAVVAVLAVAVGGGIGATETAPDPSGGTGPEGPVYAVGRTVYFPADERTATIDDTAIKSLYYTSAGLVVRHGDNAFSDGGGPQRFSLVDGSGAVHPLALETEGTVHASDPDQPYVAYAEAVDGELQVVVYDVAADAEAARVTVGPTSEDWFPVSLDGEAVWVQDGFGSTYRVDWRSGTAERSDVGTAWEVSEQRVATTRDGAPAVVDTATGEVLWTAEVAGYGSLSPDGRHVLIVDESAMDATGGEGPSTSQVFDVDTGSAVEVTADGWGWSWTAGSDLFTVTDDGRMVSCDPGSGDCTEQQVTLPQAPPEECYTETTTGKFGGVSSWCEGGTLDVILGGQARES